MALLDAAITGAALGLLGRRRRTDKLTSLLRERLGGNQMKAWPVATKGWLGQGACIDPAHRAHAQVEDAILPHFPYDFGVNAAWLTAAMTGQIQLA
jgi:hypothetical protein